MSRLEETGVIRKRVALVDREKLGLSVLVFSHVKLWARQETGRRKSLPAWRRPL